MVNCEATKEMGWNPKVGGEGRRSVYLTGTTYGLHLGVEALRYGLSFMYPTDRSRSLGADSLFMVPYPKFTQEGIVDPTNSGVFLFNVEQLQDLQKLLGLTPTPVAGK